MRRPKTSLLIALLTLGGLLVGIHASNGAAVKKTYVASATVDTGTDGHSTTIGSTPARVLYTITNTSNGPQDFASANITVPSTLTVCPSADVTCDPAHLLVTRPPGTGTFTASVAANLIAVRSTTNSGIPPAGAITIELWISVTGTCTSTSWTTQVRQSNDFSGSGNDFTGNSAVPGARLMWTTQPPPMVKTATPVPVGVSAQDACGTSSTTIQVTDAAAMLSGTSLSTDPVAAFTVTFSGKDYNDNLTASAAGFAPATTDSFYVAENVGACTTTPCDSFEVVGTKKTAADILLTPPGVEGHTTAYGAASEGGPQALCSSESNFVKTSVSETFTVNSIYDSGKTVTFTVAKALVNAISNNGAPFMSVCFLDPTSTNAAYELPDCTYPNGTFRSAPPCVVSRGKNAANEVVVVQLPAGDPKLNLY